MRWWVFVALIGVLGLKTAVAQAGDGVLSDAEVEAIRDANFVPVDCIHEYEKILNVREKAIEGLLSKPRHAGREQDIHDLMDQMAAIADELTDHLDEYGKNQRDIRKALPKLVQATERWATTLRVPAENEAYQVVRKLALDAIADMRDAAEKLETEQEDYFKAHPDAAKAEKARAQDPHAARTPD